MKRLFILFFSCVLLAACTSQQTPGFDKLIYQFHDSSVPPEYHRSYTIVMTANSLTKMVDSYGDTISYQDIKTTPEDFKQLTAAVSEAQLKNCEHHTNEGCAGGTGISIHLYQNNKKIFSGNHSKCGGKDEGNLCGNHEKILNTLNKWIKPAEEILEAEKLNKELKCEE